MPLLLHAHVPAQQKGSQVQGKSVEEEGAVNILLTGERQRPANHVHSAFSHIAIRLPTEHTPGTHLPEGTGVGSSEGAGVRGSTRGSGASAEAGFWWMKSRACRQVGRWYIWESFSHSSTRASG